MTQPLVEIDGVSKRFGDFVAVERMDLDISEGEFLAIMGSSGCGKTTTLRMLAGLDAPSEGEIRLNGERINELRTWDRDTPLVWQNLALFPFLNVRENVEFGLRMRGIASAERRARANKWLERLGIEEFAERNISQLSGGQRQRVALARSLVIEPPMLLLDEPLSALDANLKVRMQSVLTHLQKEIGITFVYVTHSHSEAFAMADRVVIMSRGNVEQIGTPQEIYRNPRNRFVAEFIGGKNIVPGHVTAVEPEGAVIAESEHGRFRARSSSARSVAVGEPVTICIGADHIRFSDDSADCANTLECRVIGEEFVGSMITFYLETETGLELQLQRAYADTEVGTLVDGSRVRVQWDSDSALILQEQ
ncbi:ABC transporter ATP-binding protein [Arhodomonas sp. SL1]|uniref:ABC transporter ATP-binding protein n=1 Tax=Arhodomonas sp. SL1 TaxID=3425691 RepID=UPI003F88519F